MELKYASFLCGTKLYDYYKKKGTKKGLTAQTEGEMTNFEFLNLGNRRKFAF